MQTKTKDVRYCGVSEQKIAESHPQLNTQSLELFAHWISERYQIHLKKEAGEPQPWTNDPILANYRFTNVRREQDRQTKYLIRNIIENSRLRLEDKIINIIMFRYWNMWETMRDLGGPWTIEQLNSDATVAEAEAKYRKFVDVNPKHGFFTRAFFTSGAKIQVRRAFGRDNTVIGCFDLARYAIKYNIPGRVLNAPDQKIATEIIKTMPGIANFLGYQIFVDLTYMPEFPFSENEFTVAGPGCKNGLRRLFMTTDGLNFEECVFWLRDNLPNIAPQLRPMELMTDLPEEDRFLSVMSLENCLCEFSKYHRAYFGQGRPKQKYRPYKE